MHEVHPAMPFPSKLINSSRFLDMVKKGRLGRVGVGAGLVVP